MLKEKSYTFKLLKPIVESAFLILALLITIRAMERTLPLINCSLNAKTLRFAVSLSFYILLLGLSLIWPVLELLSALLRCRLAQTAIVGELLVSLSHVLIISRVLSDLSDHTVLDDVLDELVLVLHRGRGKNMMIQEGVDHNLVVLVELRKVQ